MKSFAKQVAAYLTGWVIAQSIFRKLWELYYSDFLAEQRAKQTREMAEAVAAELLATVPRPSEEGDVEILGRIDDNPRAIISWKGAKYYAADDDALYVRPDRSHSLADEIMVQLDARHNPVELHAIRESVSDAIRKQLP